VKLLGAREDMIRLAVAAAAPLAAHAFMASAARPLPGRGGAFLAVRPPSPMLSSRAEAHRRPRTSLAQTQENGEQPPAQDSAPPVSALQYVWFLLALPVGAAIFPALVAAAQAATDQEQRRALIIAFLIMKRVYLYAAAISIVDVAARRCRDLPLGLGERVRVLNKEVFGGVLSTQQMQQLESSEATQAYKQLDKLEGTSQAAALPVFLALSLATSFAATKFLGLNMPITETEGVDVDLGAVRDIARALGDALRAAAPYISVPLQAAVCVLFTQVSVVL